METDTTPTPPQALPEGRFSGRVDFTEMIRLAFAAAAQQGWREIIVCDPDFEDWPLGERVVVQALNDWSKTGRTFTMLARNYDEVLRRHARFVTWRRTWAHIIECRANASAPADDLPSALLGPGWVFERLDLQRCTGMAGSEPARRVTLRERLNERLLKSSPAFPATTLGL
ncbi:hypothetical protein PMI15_00875 [Polaromonas sp. CF318]|uniref:hypothetical protein n=1 Tax=Polaromonas sp. CF318 TaxID=1144318 RepID=UPI0002710FDD|nr:hypothetical protein [Polaromonas sp. CF318]EJL88083.1 hypothetical protein PMI15_00875 [Polaromonas sp. CF318]